MVELITIQSFPVKISLKIGLAFVKLQLLIDYCCLPVK